MSIGEGRINTKFKQTAAKIKISSDLLENVCKSINVCTSSVPWNHQATIGFQRE